MLSFTVIVGLASAFGESLKPVKPLAMSMLQLKKKEKSSSIVANTEKVEIPGRVASGRASSLCQIKYVDASAVATRFK